MDIQELRNKLTFLSDGSLKTAVVYLLMKSPNDTDEIRKAEIEQTAQTEILQKAIALLQKEIIDNEDLSFMSLSEADERKNVLYEYDLDSPITGLMSLQTVLSNDDINDFQKKHPFSEIKAIVIVISNSGHQLAIYQKSHPINVLKKDRLAFLKGSSNRLDRLSDDILLMPNALDFLQIDDTLLIKNLKLLESSFGYFEAVEKSAASSIADIAARNIVEDTAPLQKWLKDKTLARKIAKLATNSPVLQKRIPLTTIVSFTKEHPSLKHIFKYSDDDKIILKSKKTINFFIKLLNDDYLTSELTSLHYESLAKDGVESEDVTENVVQ